MEVGREEAGGELRSWGKRKEGGRGRVSCPSLRRGEFGGTQTQQDYEVQAA